MKTESYCISGSFTPKPIICNETPFSLNYDGKIYCNEDIFLTKTHTNIFGKTYEIPWDVEMGRILVRALNDTYKAGYEKDRTT